MSKFVDRAGKRYGKLTAISFSKKNGCSLWLCRCDCGAETTVVGGLLQNGNTKSCGCQQGDPIDETGKRYGRLLVISKTSSKKQRNGKGAYAAFVCLCDCGKEAIVRGQCLRSGNSQSCGCFRIDRVKEVSSLPHGVSALNRAIANMKSNARRRGLAWELSDDQVIKFMNMSCFYCGDQPSNVGTGRNGNYIYNGLDRVDNSLPYTLANVVPCCICCNNAKRTMSREQFLDWSKRLYAHSFLSKKEDFPWQHSSLCS